MVSYTSDRLACCFLLVTSSFFLTLWIRAGLARGLYNLLTPRDSHLSLGADLLTDMTDRQQILETPRTELIFKDRWSV